MFEKQLSQGDGKPAPNTAVQAVTTRHTVWLYSAAGALVLLFVLVFKANLFHSQSEAVQARTPSTSVDASRITATKAGDNASAKPGQTNPDTSSVATNDVSTSALAADSTREPTLNELRLQGVISSSRHPSAIISGQTVWLHDTIAGARLVEIGRTNVVLEYENQRKILTLR
jgi:hypothetical protein